MLVVYILAGGEGRRFGGDKLAALVEDRASIARVAEAVRDAGGAGVYAVTRSYERCRLYQSLGGVDGCIYDSPPLQGCEGPAVAIYTALRDSLARGARAALIVPGDTPWLEASVLRRLLTYTPTSGSATVVHGDGYLESLLQLHNSDALEAAARGVELFCRLRGYGRPTDALRTSPQLTLLGTLLLADSPTAFAHINTRENIRARQPKSPPAPRLLLQLHPPAARGRDSSICSILKAEKEYYTMHGVAHLAEQAERDLQTICR